MQSSYMNKVNPNARQNNARHPEKQIDYYNIFRYYRNPAKESWSSLIYHKQLFTAKV